MDREKGVTVRFSVREDVFETNSSSVNSFIVVDQKTNDSLKKGLIYVSRTADKKDLDNFGLTPGEVITSKELLNRYDCYKDFWDLKFYDRFISLYSDVDEDLPLDKRLMAALTCDEYAWSLLGLYEYAKMDNHEIVNGERFELSDESPVYLYGFSGWG